MVHSIIDLRRVECELHEKESLSLEEVAKLLESLIIIESFADEETYYKLLLLYNKGLYK